MPRDNKQASKLYQAMSEVIPCNDEMSPASDAEYGAVRALLDGGAHLTQAEVAEIKGEIEYYSEQASEEYAGGAACFFGSALFGLPFEPDTVSLLDHCNDILSSGDINWAYMSSAKEESWARCLELHAESEAGTRLEKRFEMKQAKERKEMQQQEAAAAAREASRSAEQEKRMMARVAAAKAEVLKYICFENAP